MSKEDTLLLVQRALVLLGSASHQISLERRKVAWEKISPKLKYSADEEVPQERGQVVWARLLRESNQEGGSRQGIVESGHHTARVSCQEIQGQI